MAHIELRTSRNGTGELIVNGVDLSMEVYSGSIKLVEQGEGDLAEVGLQVTLVVSRLDLDTEADVAITDHFRSVATRVRSVVEASA